VTVSVLETGIYALLTGQTDAADRLYPTRGKQGRSMPYIVFERTDTDNKTASDGDLGVAVAGIRFRIWGSDYPSVRTVSEAIRGLMSGKGPVTWGGIFVNSSFLRDEGSLYAVPEHGDEGTVGWYMDFEITHEVTV
jgi:hypothetical protein